MTYADGEKSVKKWEYAKGSRTIIFRGEETASLEITNRRVIAETRGKACLSRTELDLNTIQSVGLEYGSGSLLGVILMIIGALIIGVSLIFGGGVLIGLFAGIGAVCLAIGLSLLGVKVKIVFYLTACSNGFINVSKGRKIKRGYRTIKVNKEQSKEIIETLGAYLLEVKNA